MENKLKKIDFSEGIYSDEINENFNKILGEVERERKNIGGPGIASGLELEVVNNEYDFGVNITPASIITNDGDEIHLDKTYVEIEPPKLSKEIEYLTVNSSNQIILKHVPYSLNRRSPVQFSGNFTPEKSGIVIKYRNSQNEDDFIRVKDIEGRTLTLSGIIREKITITYYYTEKRIDTLYLDNDYNVKTISGITSTTPSVIMPKEYKYLIANIEINPFYSEKNQKVTYANITLKKDLRETRNIYTDKDGKLYICGIPFKDLQIINILEPENPKENDLWLDTFNNTLNMWKATDTLVYRGQFICETNYSYKPTFRQDYTCDIAYYVGCNQLSVYVNDRKLEKDEFAEIKNGAVCTKLDKERGVRTKDFRIYKELSIGDKINYRIEYTDSHYTWVPINKTTFVNAKETKLFGKTDEYEFGNYFATDEAIAMGSDENHYPYKYQYFIFHHDKDKNMLFTPGRNELSLCINQTPLHYDQFEEITYLDLIDNKLPVEVTAAAEDYFGWDIGIQSRYEEKYDSLGIGFKMAEPLDVDIAEEANGATDLFVEAIVERRISDSPFKRKLQRTSNFVYEKNLTIKDETQKIIDIDEGIFYRYKESQLEVFLNGKRLTKDIDYLEATDILGKDIESNRYAIRDNAYPEKARGAVSRQFEIIINPDINNIPNSEFYAGAKLTYKITTNIYSYDHINSLIDDLEFKLDTSTEKVDEAYNKTRELQNDMENSLNYVYTEIDKLKESSGTLEGKYLTPESIIREEQLPAHIVSNIPKSLDHINYSIIFKSGTSTYDVTSDLREADFITIIKRDILTQNDRFMIRDIDYRIIDTFDTHGYTGTLLEIMTNTMSLMNDGDTLIVTGIEFGKAGR